jgi:ligand-binding SRPBCC domain-containing protein
LEVFVYCSQFDAPSNEVFARHCRDGAFERRDPPWGRHFIVKGREKRRHNSSNGSYVTIQIPLVKRTSITCIVKQIEYIEGNQSRDIKISGPFSS